MIEETVEKRKKGGQPGNQNAKKEFTASMLSVRVSDEIKEKIKNQAKVRGFNSQGKYIAWLVEADCK